ncbi:MAG: hypothetical protein GXY48_01445 [Methanomicrobiales archaeon]|nr:hypothetical protein [Methanomicrobiales archaeon]
MKHEAVFTFHSPDAGVIAASLIPESDTEPAQRTFGQCKTINDSVFTVNIGAEDLTALRAALNSWLRLVQIADEMVQTTKKVGTTND